MRIDDEGPEAQFQEEADNFPIQKLKKRMTLISIFIPCLIIVIILVAYFDIKKNLFKVDSSGTMGVQALSKTLESKFSSLSIREANLEEAFGKKIESLEKTVGSLQKSVKEATTAIKHIRSARKSDNEKIEHSITEIDNTLATVPSHLAKISSDLKSLDLTFTKKMTDLSQTVKNSRDDLLKMRSEISSIKSSKVDKNDLKSALKDQQEIYQIALRQLTVNLEEQINDLEKRLKKLDRTGASSGKQKENKPNKTLSSTQKDVGGKQAPSSMSTKEINLPKPGTIIEQDLQNKPPS